MAALPLAARVLADGPAMYFGGSIISFALPMGAIIVVALVLFFLLRARHSGPRLKYLTTSGITSVSTREPGPAPAPSVAAEEAKPAAEPKAEAKAEDGSPAPTETKETKGTTNSTEAEE